MLTELILSAILQNMKIKFIILLIIFSFLTLVPSAFGQAKKEATNSTTESSEYKLSYPGMLPDSPFYKLKTLRDKIILAFIRDPYKKSTKYLELADKQLFAALKIAEKNNLSLAIHTAFKGEHQITLLTYEVKKIAYSGKKLDKEFLNKVHQATKEHQKLLVGIKARAKAQDKKSLETIISFSKHNDNELSKLEKEVNAKFPVNKLLKK